MKKILVLLTLLLSLQVYGEVAISKVQDVGVELEKGNPDKADTHPRSLIPITCVYADGMVQLTLLVEVGEYTLTVTNQSTGEQWSADNALILQTSTASGTYWVQIETEDGSLYWGTYTL